MTCPDYTHISLLLDRSGSMEAVADDTIGGFNQFLSEQQKQPGRCTFTLVQFDTHNPQEVVYDTAPITEIQPLTGETFQPRGGTPLLDAMGQLILDTGAKLGAMPEEQRPGKVVLVTLTDGQENSSVRYSRERVFELVRHQQDVYQWQFVFLGANQDAIAEAGGLGIDARLAMSYRSTGKGTRAAFASASRVMSSVRSASRLDMASIAFSEAERAEQELPDDTTPPSTRPPARR